MERVEEEEGCVCWLVEIEWKVISYQLFIRKNCTKKRNFFSIQHVERKSIFLIEDIKN